MSTSTFEQQLLWRASRWRSLLEAHPNTSAPASTIRSLGIYSGFRGVWVDKQRTASTAVPSGITIGVRHDGSSYADRLSDTGLIYKFPDTERRGHDELEIEATRTAMRLGLPIFVVSGHKDAPTREVRLAYVEACNDEAHEFLLVFVPQPILGPLRPMLAHESAPEWLARRLASRANERRFAFEVMERYGPCCAVCDINARPLLASAHLRPKFAKGTDDPQNGLVLCANHHLAMDAGLWRVNPKEGSVIARSGVDLDSIGVRRRDLSLLRAHPSTESLEWLWKLDFKHVHSAMRPRRTSRN
ncbi:HNH endonuclease [Microbacterium gallinarum]|uniref:HNH endonuclease n=1 Tax=Microbacterium gallinarum TaxID=2762209 RepID=A0ABR8X6F3_9MICO|nr:HNH endonuclease [Microbacterium gallinarum]MBD8024864.1 HNH endonuclease [Microbacterium gallinarum]